MSDFIASVKANFNTRYPGIHHAIVKYYFTSIIILVIFFAFILRYFQLNIGLPYLYFWDEPLTANNALQMLKTGDYNPHFFKYGSLMIYFNLLIDQLYRIYLSLTGDLASAAKYTHCSRHRLALDHIPSGLLFLESFFDRHNGHRNSIYHLFNQQDDMQQMGGHHIGLFFSCSPDPHCSFGLCNNGRASRPVCLACRPILHFVYPPKKNHLFHIEFNMRRICHSDKIQFGPGNFAPHCIADLDVLPR